VPCNFHYGTYLNGALWSEIGTHGSQKLFSSFEIRILTYILISFNAMSLSKITAALASATNEVTLAAANLNFDFSLVKLAAPKEFSAIGLALSERRRDDAENGPSHITARKLGALFEELIPPIQHLIRQYGLRASEISASPIINPKGSAKDGLFASQVGLDGTGLWAAATSGTAAISVHLLACMLARIWSGPEATSIWVQIVQDRRKEIERALDNDSVHYKTLAAARHDITRQQLAEWDASARAWLYEADKVHQRQQQQLLLILNNIEVAVNHKPEVYDNVMSAWKTGMETLNAIVQGAPQQVQDGAVLLGLSAWHLYPDMHILGNTPKEIKMKDPLVADGGTITLGLQHNGRQGPRGVHWSLSLAHLKYYGKPVITTRSTESDSSRITFNELWTAALGSLWSMWGASFAGDALHGARFITTLWDTIDQACHQDLAFKESFELKNFKWLKSLAQASRNIIESEGVEHNTAMRLFGLGQRIGASFLLVQGRPCVPPAFGLNSIEALLSLLSNEGLIILFRQYVEQYYLEQFAFGSAIIRYVQPLTDFVYTDASIKSQRSVPETRQQGQENHNTVPNDMTLGSPAPTLNSFEDIGILEDTASSLGSAEDIDNEASQIIQDAIDAADDWQPSKRVHTFAYASVVSVPMRSKKRSHAGHQVEEARHTRWIPRSVGQYLNAEGRIDKGAIDSSKLDTNSFYNIKTDEKTHEQNWNDLHSIDNDMLVWNSNDGEEPQLYKRVIGSPNAAALFVHEHHTPLLQLNGDLLTLDLPWERMITIFSKTEHLSPTLCQAFNDSQQTQDVVNDDDVDEILNDYTSLPGSKLQFDDPDSGTGLKFATIDPLTAGLGSNSWSIPPPIRKVDMCLGFRDYSSLRVLQCLSSVYQLLAHATIPCSIVQTPILSYSWAKSTSSRLQAISNRNLSSDIFHLSRKESFEAIASFETGYSDIVISEDVMALACGNSLYVAGLLLCDPYETPHDYEIRRIVGNIGRAGIALFVPPKDLQIKDASAKEWTMVRHAEFDGESIDSFKATTLHLSFTGFETPLGNDRFGHRDVEIFYLETLISVHDRGSWIADIDILRALRDPALQRLNFTSCDHGLLPKPKTRLTSIDNWSEVLDKPDGHSIARASKNWLARLALVSVSVQRGGSTVVLPESPCWNCIAAKTGRLRPRRRGMTSEGDPWMFLRIESKCQACYRNDFRAAKNAGEEGPITMVW
jgi:hypothetical protein